MTDDDFIWQVRAFVYGWFAGQAHAPRVADIAAHFDISAQQADEALIALHEKHALFLKPGTVDIRMANPFSAIPTSFVVKVQEIIYWANCAWDCFGIVAARCTPHRRRSNPSVLRAAIDSTSKSTPGKYPVRARLCISWCPFGAGMMIWWSSERRSDSSGRKTPCSNGVHRATAAAKA